MVTTPEAKQKNNIQLLAGTNTGNMPFWWAAMLIFLLLGYSLLAWSLVCRGRLGGQLVERFGGIGGSMYPPFPALSLFLNHLLYECIAFVEQIYLVWARVYNVCISSVSSHLLFSGLMCLVSGWIWLMRRGRWVCPYWFPSSLIGSSWKWHWNHGWFEVLCVHAAAVMVLNEGSKTGARALVYKWPNLTHYFYYTKSAQIPPIKTMDMGHFLWGRFKIRHAVMVLNAILGPCLWYRCWE